MINHYKTSEEKSIINQVVDKQKALGEDPNQLIDNNLFVLGNLPSYVPFTGSRFIFLSLIRGFMRSTRLEAGDIINKKIEIVL